MNREFYPSRQPLANKESSLSRSSHSLYHNGVATVRKVHTEMGHQIRGRAWRPPYPPVRRGDTYTDGPSSCEPSSLSLLSPLSVPRPRQTSIDTVTAKRDEEPGATVPPCSLHGCPITGGGHESPPLTTRCHSANERPQTQIRRFQFRDRSYHPSIQTCETAGQVRYV